MLYRWIRPYWGWLAASAGCALLFAVTRLAMGGYIKTVTDASLNFRNRELIVVTVGMALLAVAGTGAKFMIRFASSRLSAYTVRDIRREAVKRLLRMPVSSAERGRSGETLTRITTDLNVLQGYLNAQLYNLVYQPILFLGAFTMLLLVQWRLVMLCALLAPPAVLLSQWLGKPIRRFTDITLGKQGKLNADAKEAVEGLPVIHAFGLSRMFTERFRILADDTLSSSIALERRKALLSPISIIAYGAPLLIGVAVGGRWVDAGLMSVSDILLFMYLLVFLIQPLALMPSLIGATNEMAVAVRRLREWMELPQEQTGDEDDAADERREPMSREQMAEAAGDDRIVVRSEAGADEGAAVVFDNVTLIYGDGPPVLQGISLSIPAGRTVAIVGPSGAGKSSIARLICGDQPVGRVEGDVRVLGRSVAQWPKAELRRHIALVAQEPFLFPMSIGDNIGSGWPDAGRADEIEAAKLAHAHEFIERLPRGYDTRLGERGAGLSRGERQRIAIARAIVKDAPLLLLDEASSALDPRSESLVSETVQAYAQGRTVLIIAHRLSSIRLADEVLVLDEGRIVERGPYEELASAPGSRFMQLFGRQVAGQTSGVRLQEGGRSHVSVPV